MIQQQTQFKSEYHGFDDDYKAEMLKLRLSFSRLNFEQMRYKFAAQLRGSVPNFA